jgi:hypothetical protein
MVVTDDTRQCETGGGTNPSVACSDETVFSDPGRYNTDRRAGWFPPREDDDRDCHFRALAFLGASALSIPLTVSENVWPVLERDGLPEGAVILQ